MSTGARSRARSRKRIAKHSNTEVTPPSCDGRDLEEKELAKASPMPFHPAADVLPMLSPEEFAILVADIKRFGLREPIWTYEGKIIDGRNRELACIEAGVKPHYRPFQGAREEIPGVVISLNIHRRHLSLDQKHKLLEKLVKLYPEKSNRQLAKMARVSDKTVAGVRERAEARAEIPHVTRRMDSKGRKQPAKKLAENKRDNQKKNDENPSGNQLHTTEERPQHTAPVDSLAIDSTAPAQATKSSAAAEDAPSTIISPSIFATGTGHSSEIQSNSERAHRLVSAITNLLSAVASYGEDSCRAAADCEPYREILKLDEIRKAESFLLKFASAWSESEQIQQTKGASL